MSELTTFAFITFSLIFFGIEAINPEAPIIYFNRPLLSRRDTLGFRDSNATIGRVAVGEKPGIPKYLYVNLNYDYLLLDVLETMGKKDLSVQFLKVPSDGWKTFYENVRNKERRTIIEIAVARGPGVEQDATIIDYTYKPMDGLNVVVMGFNEIEDEAFKYTESMILSMSHAFKRNISVAHQWLRLNAYHVKNIRDFYLKMSLFENLRDRVIVYQNYSIPRVFREDVLKKMVGFDLDKIIWENVDSKPADDTTEENISKGNDAKPALGVFHLLILVLKFMKLF